MGGFSNGWAGWVSVMHALQDDIRTGLRSMVYRSYKEGEPIYRLS